MFLFSNSTLKHKNCPFNHFEQHNSRQSYIEDFKISKNIKGGPLCPFHNHLLRKRMSFSHLICSVVLKQGLITLLQVLCQRNQWFMLSRLEELCLKVTLDLNKKEVYTSYRQSRDFKFYMSDRLIGAKSSVPQQYLPTDWYILNTLTDVDERFQRKGTISSRDILQSLAKELKLKGFLQRTNSTQDCLSVWFE